MPDCNMFPNKTSKHAWMFSISNFASLAKIAILAGSVAASAGIVFAEADDINVFAAASMTNALAEIEQGFEAVSSHELTVSLAGSSILARQIQHGAPADIFISANPGWMDVLGKAGFLEAGSRFNLVENSLVLISADTSVKQTPISPGMDLSGSLDGGYLAMALVDAVPAGIYGKAALESLGLWETVASKVAQTDNVRSALALVATGEARYGIVYATDAVAEERVKVIGTFPPETHPPIVYPVASIANRNFPAAREFLDYLRGPEAKEAFERQGFVVTGK